MSQDPSRILLVKCSALGDIVQCFPVLSYLRRRFPDAQIDWLVEQRFASLLEAHPDLHQVLYIDSKRKEHFADYRRKIREQRYDIAFDLQGNIKSGLVMSQVCAEEKVGFAWKDLAEWPNWFFTRSHYRLPEGQSIREDYLSLVKSHFGDRDPSLPDCQVTLRCPPDEVLKVQQLLIQAETLGRSLALICPGSAWSNKQLGAETFLEFLECWRGQQDVAYLFLWGNEQERELAQRLQQAFPSASLLLPRLELATLQRLMAQLDYVLSMDSLPLHLAGTTSTPCFAFFGPSSAQKYRPQGAGSCQGSCPYGERFSKRCSQLRSCKTGACLKSRNADELFHAFWSWKKPAQRAAQNRHSFPQL